MSFLIQILIIFVIAVVALVIYNFLKPFILNKLKPNKWLLLALIVVTFFTPIFLPQVYSSLIFTAIFFVLITLFALSYVDTLKLEKIAKNKPVVGKPKAKPNRANKHTN